MTRNDSINSIRAFIVGLATMSVLLLAAVARSQVAAVYVREDPVELISDTFDNPSTELLSIFVGTVESPGAATIQLHIADYELGSESYLTLTSVVDGDVQRLDATTIQQSYNWTATLNGDAVDIDLHISPGDGGAYVEIDAMRTPETFEAEEGAVASICGSTDDRVASNDPRIGRTTRGCTAWLVSNGAVLSAGHCPIFMGDFVHFNVPQSLVNGAQLVAAAVDQYPINVGSVVQENSGPGMDWQVFGLNANTTTLRTAHNVRGFFRMIKYVPTNGTVLRVTGCGLDNSAVGTGGPVCNGGTNHNANCLIAAPNCPGGVCTPADCCDHDGDLICSNNCNSASATQQTHTGTLSSSTADRIQHTVDTMPGNSGSPIIWEGTDLTFGIHTAGGCTSTGGTNNGTRFNRAVLETAIRDFPAVGTVYADNTALPFPINGGVFEPFRTVGDAINAAPDNGTVCLVPGNYPRVDATNRFTVGADGKGITIVSPAGSSIIGN